MVNIVQVTSNKKRFSFGYSTSYLVKDLIDFSKKIDRVGVLQAIRNVGEGYILHLVYNYLYRPVDTSNGLRVKNPFDGCNGNGTGGTTQAQINLKNDPKATLFLVSLNYYKSFRSYHPSETYIGQLLELLGFFKWYLSIAIGMIIAYPAIRIIQKEFPQQGEKLKKWYATTPPYYASECDIKT